MLAFGWMVTVPAQIYCIFLLDNTRTGYNHSEATRIHVLNEPDEAPKVNLLIIV